MKIEIKKEIFDYIESVSNLNTVADHTYIEYPFGFIKHYGGAISMYKLDGSPIEGEEDDIKVILI
jgi:hypothetical protein